MEMAGALSQATIKQQLGGIGASGRENTPEESAGAMSMQLETCVADRRP